jgi:hypothetical protein
MCRVLARLNWLFILRIHFSLHNCIPILQQWSPNKMNCLHPLLHRLVAEMAKALLALCLWYALLEVKDISV